MTEGALLVAGVAATLILMGLVEIAALLISRAAEPIDRSRRTAILVLGYPTKPDGSVRALHRWRVSIAKRTLGAIDDGWLIFTGCPTGGAGESEARAMAHHATTHLGVSADRIALEERANSTWANTLFSIPMAEEGGATQIVIASDPFHADKARRYARLQFPSMRVARARDYRLLEHPLLKALTAAYYVVLRARGGYGSAPPPEFVLPSSADG